MSAAGAGQAAFLEAIAASDPVASDEHQCGSAGRPAEGRRMGEVHRRRRQVARRAAAAAAVQGRRVKLSQAAAVTVIGLTPADAGHAAASRGERDAARGFGKFSTRSIVASCSLHRVRALRARWQTLRNARRNVVIVFAVALAVFLGVGIFVLRRALRFERAEARRARTDAIERAAPTSRPSSSVASRWSPLNRGPMW